MANCQLCCRFAHSNFTAVQKKKKNLPKINSVRAEKSIFKNQLKNSGKWQSEADTIFTKDVDMWKLWRLFWIQIVVSQTFFNWFWNLFFKMPIPWSMSIYHDYIYKYLRLLIVVKDLKVNNAADMFNIYVDELRSKCQLFMAIFFIFINASFWLQSQRFRKVLEFIFWWFIIILIQ